MIEDLHFRDTDTGRKATVFFRIRGRALRLVVDCREWIERGDAWLWRRMHAVAYGVDERTIAALE